MPHSSAPAQEAHLITHISHWPVFPDLEAEVTLSFGNEVTALIGRNGVGKTRLLKHLVGLEPWPNASVSRSGLIGYLPQNAAPPRDISIETHLGVAAPLQALERLEVGKGSEDDLTILADRWDLRTRVSEALHRVGLQELDVRRGAASLSGGEFTRTELARLELSGAHFLIFDEPTNHLDKAARAYVQDFLRSWPGGILVATHDREIMAGVDRIIELSAFGARLHSGNYADYLAHKKQERHAAERKAEDARKRLKQVERQVQRSTERAATRARQGRKMRRDGSHGKSALDSMKAGAEVAAGRRARHAEQSLGQRVDEVKAAEAKLERLRLLAFDLPSCGAKPGRTLLKVERTTFRFPEQQELLLPPVSFALSGGDKLAIKGANGTGKSTLLRILARDLAPTSGEVVTDDTRHAWLDQKTEMLEGHETILSAFLASNKTANAGEAHAALASFLFRGQDALKPIRHLSGGERLRAALAILLFAPEPPQVLLLDEPSNHLDLDSQGAVASALRAYDGALILVSHDDSFLKDVGVNEVLSLDETRGFPDHPPTDISITPERLSD